MRTLLRIVAEEPPKPEEIPTGGPINDGEFAVGDLVWVKPQFQSRKVRYGWGDIARNDIGIVINVNKQLNHIQIKFHRREVYWKGHIPEMQVVYPAAGFGFKKSDPIPVGGHCAFLKIDPDYDEHYLYPGDVVMLDIDDELNEKKFDGMINTCLPFNEKTYQDGNWCVGDKDFRHMTGKEVYDLGMDAMDIIRARLDKKRG